MKPILNIAKLFLVFTFLFSISSRAQIQDGVIDDPGDIAFVAFHDNRDGFSFVFLDSCPANTMISFVDEEYDNSIPGFPCCSESELIWENNTGSTIAAGTVIDIFDDTDNIWKASTGSLIENNMAQVGSSDFGNFTTGVTDEVYALTGTRESPGVYLAFIGDAPLPPSLSNGTNAIIITGEGYYTGSPVCNSSITDCSAMINNVANWTIGSFSFPTDVPNTFTGSAITPNTAPTASSFTASPGPFEDQVYTFVTGDFGYSDSNGDPLNNLLVELIPPVGTLYVDANNSDTFDGGEQLSNGSTVSKADLDTGNLQYIQSGSTNTSFQFEVNDGTENSTGNYIATINVTASPILNSTTPTDGAIGVATNSNITLTFDKNVALGTGNIQIIDLDDASSTIIIDANSPGAQASISSATLTLNPTINLEELTNYAIQIAATAIDGTDGSSFTGISDNTTFNFITADETAPSGYTVGIDQAPINSTNETAISFTFAGAEVGATYNYTFSSDGGGTDVMGTGTIVTATDQISGIDLSGLGDGIVTLSVTLTDPAGNIGSAATDTLAKDTSRPSVVITSTATDPTGADPIPITITFSEIVGAFAIGDITVVNGTPGGFSGSGTTYTVDIMPTANGTVTVDVAENVAFDNSSNGNTVAPQFSIQYDSTILGTQDELLSQGIKIYPIPNNGILNIAADISLQLKNTQVFDITGKLIYNKDLDKASVINSLELSGIRSGIYMIKISSANATTTKRMVIQ